MLKNKHFSYYENKNYMILIGEKDLIKGGKSELITWCPKSFCEVFEAFITLGIQMLTNVREIPFETYFHYFCTCLELCIWNNNLLCNLKKFSSAA